MRILGIDPGSECTGYGIVESDGSNHRAILFGAIKTSARHPFNRRLLQIYSELNKILSTQTVDAIAIEEIFYAANVQAALKLGHARGIALLVAAQQQRAVFEYSALEIKNSIVGYGRAEKRQVQEMVRFLLQLPEVPTPNDAADALAVAICHSHNASTRLKMSLKVGDQAS